MSTLDEAALIESILKGDSEAFRFLYRAHAGSAWRLAYSMCKHKVLAEEAVQNSFVNAFRYLKSFRSDSSFKTWLLRIVFNEVIRLQQAEKKYRWQDLPYETDDDVMLTFSIAEPTSEKDMKEKVHQIMAQLNEKDALVMNLFYLEGLSIKEMAAVLGYEAGNVKVLLYRARKNFKLKYENL